MTGAGVKSFQSKRGNRRFAKPYLRLRVRDEGLW
jgi:hypothetical protein